MELPEAYICHRSAQRLRIKIASRKGDAAYFDECRDALARIHGFDRLEVNALTGSVLFIGEKTDVDGIAEVAQRQQLFKLAEQPGAPAPLTRQLVSHLENLNTGIHRLTTGEMDLAGLVLLLLLISGFIELLRGRIRMPPWYTAFWYAFGIYQVAAAIREKNSDSA